MIKLEDHIIFDHETKQQVVPLEIAQKAIQESFTYANDKIASNLEIVMKGVASSMTDLNNAVKDSLKDD
jgi:hypothetical protein|tara:strand:+ start:1661 stop:1867 length:207 start_codon:yes stop_codon:yes gene_type:complete